MKTVNVIRLFMPMLIGVIIVLYFTMYASQKLVNITSISVLKFEEIEKFEKRFSNLEDDKKVKVAEWLFETDVGGYNIFFETTNDVTKFLTFIKIILIISITIQIISLLSYFILSKKHSSAIDHNGLQVSLMILSSGIAYGIYIFIRGEVGTFDAETPLFIYLLLAVVLIMLWFIKKQSMLVAVLFLVSILSTIGVYIIDKDYGPLLIQFIYLYASIEIVVSIHRLKTKNLQKVDG